MAYAETRKRLHEGGNATVQVSLPHVWSPFKAVRFSNFFYFFTQLLNITISVAWPAVEQKVPVDITFAVRDGRGYLPGSEVSEHLRKLSLVEFSFYVGFPALQIAERTRRYTNPSHVTVNIKPTICKAFLSNFCKQPFTTLSSTLHTTCAPPGSVQVRNPLSFFYILV